MTLQRKFAILIGLLSLTAAVSLGGALWSVNILDREVARPFTAAAGLSSDLRAGAVATDSLIEAVRADRTDEASAFLVPLRQSGEALGDLDYGAVRLGARTASLLQRSTRDALTTVEGWIESEEESDRKSAATTLRAHAGLLRRLQTQAAESVDLAAEHVREVRGGIVLVQVVAVVTAFLAALLALSLHRRWIVEPVARLRVGAERLAEGDLDYRVEERGRDELAMLGREVNQMAATVKRMQSEAVERERFAAVGQVVRRLAHNIRNPLAGIRSLAETTLDDLPKNDEREDAQRRIISTVDRFDGWLTDFLHASSPARVAPVECDPSPWLEGAVEALRPMGEGRGVKIRVDLTGAPRHACFDPVQLEQAVVAVVTNAVEVTPEGGDVEINVTREGDEWVLSVIDDGPGLGEGAPDRVFDPDYTTKPGGHGIGLASARWIVRRHGGMMRAHNAESASGRSGARFDMRLPLEGRRGHDDGEVDRAEHPDR